MPFDDHVKSFPGSYMERRKGDLARGVAGMRRGVWSVRQNERESLALQVVCS